MTWERNRRDRLCSFCWHEEEMHDHSPDKRTPKEVEPGKYVCADCVDCEALIGAVAHA